MRRLLYRLAHLLVLAASCAQAHAGEVRLWHAMDAATELQVQSLASRFNAAQAEFHIVLQRATGTDGLVRLSLPWNATRPVLYVNREAMRRARLNPNAVPKTWYEMASTLGALSEAGNACAYTTGSPAWVLLDSTRGGFDNQLMVRWVSMLSTWQRAGYFSYAPSYGEAELRFASGECAMLTSSSANQRDLARQARFDVGVAPLPQYEDFAVAPRAIPAGSTSVWVSTHGVGVARFFAFIATEAALAHRRRELIDAELAAVWAGIKTPVDALSAVAAGANPTQVNFTTAK